MGPPSDRYLQTCLTLHFLGGSFESSCLQQKLYLKIPATIDLRNSLNPDHPELQ